MDIVASLLCYTSTARRAAKTQRFDTESDWEHKQSVCFCRFSETVALYWTCVLGLAELVFFYYWKKRSAVRPATALPRRLLVGIWTTRINNNKLMFCASQLFGLYWKPMAVNQTIYYAVCNSIKTDLKDNFNSTPIEVDKPKRLLVQRFGCECGCVVCGCASVYKYVYTTCARLCAMRAVTHYQTITD